MSDHYCCKTCGLRYDDCKCRPTTSVGRAKTGLILPQKNPGERTDVGAHNRMIHVLTNNQQDSTGPCVVAASLSKPAMEKLKATLEKHYASGQYLIESVEDYTC